jgi:ribosomal protein S12 methylthiotransferase accessory factor
MTSINLWDRQYTMKKGYTTGTHRTRSPRETLDDYARFMPLMGITRLANLTGLDDIGLPVYTAIRPNSRSLATSQGKGFDTDSAKASALMESIETWHAEHVTHPLRWDSYWSLAETAAVVDVTELPRLEGRELRLDYPRLWVEGYDLMRRQAMWVPYEAVTINCVSPPGHTATFCVSTNGLASDNHLLEAIVHGLCEVIERDAEALWRLTDDLRQLDLATVDDPACAQTLALLDRAGAHAAAWDLTTDTRIPVYGCAILEPPDRPTGRGLGVYYGFGCHLSPGVALMRALSEAVQTRVTYISGSRDDFYRDEYERATDEDLLRGIWEEISNPPFTEPFSAQASLATESFEGDIAVLLSALADVGVESAVVVNLTRPEIGIPVVKVIVPGLEGPFEADCERGPRAARLMEENHA